MLRKNDKRYAVALGNEYFLSKAIDVITMKNFKKLKIWQRGMQIVVKTYQLAKQLPLEEKYGLKIQICKCAVSIPSNIAEGSSKTSQIHYKNYLETSLGSAYELETQVLIIEMLQFGEKDLIKALLKDVDEEQKMIMSFIRAIGTS